MHYIFAGKNPNTVQLTFSQCLPSLVTALYYESIQLPFKKFADKIVANERYDLGKISSYNYDN